MNYEKITVGCFLKAQRELRGMTQAEFAKKVGVDRASYCRYENGKQPVGYKSAKKFAAALDIKVGDILDRRTDLQEGIK